MTLSNILAAGLLAVGEVIKLTAGANADKVTDEAGHVTLTWLIAVVFLFAFAGISFKKSRRTHLD